MQPLLFYSETCPHSRRIVGRLQQTPHADKVLRLACVDGQIERIPAEIDRVPALVVPTGTGNRVVFDAELYNWLNSILRMDDSRQQQPAPQGTQRSLRDHPAPSQGPSHSAPPMDFMSESGAFLCDLGGDQDSAGHLFAEAGEEIRLNYAGVGHDTGGRRVDQDPARDDDVINRMMAARNQELNTLYANVPRKA